MSKTLAVIPARLGATRLPNKPLRLLAGVPLVIRVWERVTAMQVADRCVIATDSDRVVAEAKQAGAERVLTRVDHPSGTDRVAEVAAVRDYAKFDTIVNIQGDEPFVAAGAVRGAAEFVSSGKFMLGTAAVKADASVLESPNVVKVIRADDGRALYFSRAGIPYLREASNLEDKGLRDAMILQHIGVYAYSREALARWVALPVHALERIERLEQLRPLAAGMSMGVTVISESPVPGIDTEEDLTRANAQWNAFIEEAT